MIEREHPAGLVTCHFASLDGTGAAAAVTTRAGGCSEGPFATLNLAYHVGDDPDRVAANRQLVCAALGVDRLTVADQQHGARVALVDHELAGAGHGSAEDARRRLPSTDAMVTDRPGVALAVVVGDCAPVVLVDPVRGAVGVAHAGRAGVVRDVLGATVAAMAAAFGSDPGDLVAGVGPCIGAERYEIAGQALAEVRTAFGDGLLTPTVDGRATFDLAGAVRQRLTAAGVQPTAVEAMDVDTGTATERFFSDRRQRPCGRFALVAVRT